MLTLEELRLLVYRDLAHSMTGNDRLPPDTIDAAINAGARLLALRTHCFARTAEVAAATGQALYSTPLDTVAVRFVAYASLVGRLTRSSVRAEDARASGWRTVAAGQPLRWLWYDARQIWLTPAPSFASGSQTIYLETTCLPYSAGSGIKTATRTLTVVTVTTKGDHRLVVGDKVRVWGIADASTGALLEALAGNFTVATAPTATTFTYATVSSGTLSGVGGVVSYQGGVPYLYLGSDVPAFMGAYHPALADFAVSALASGLIADEAEAQAKAQAASARFDAATADLIAELGRESIPA